MMLGESPAEIREALWATHVSPYCKKTPTNDREKELALLDALAHHRLQAQELIKNARQNPGDLAAAVSALSEGRIVWNLLALHSAAWLLPQELPFPPIDRQSCLNDEGHLNPESAREEIIYLLDKSAGPYFDQALDPAAVLVPRWALQELVLALRALNEGEITPLLLASATGRKMAASWDEARMRALEHVEFLVGQDVPRTIARRRVATAMKKVSPDTLRSWSDGFKHDITFKHRMDHARGAGRLKVKLEGDPEFGKRRGETIDVDELHVFEELSKIELLPKFGDRYNREFGNRHNSIPTAGD